MRNLNLLLALCLMAILSACKVDDSNLQKGSIIGKWRETKLELHQVTGAHTSVDTIFTCDALTSADYFQFNSDHTAVISKSGDFSIHGKRIITNDNIIPDWLTHYKYTMQDTVLTLSLTDAIPNPSASGIPVPRMETIVHVDAENLVMHLDYIPQSASTYPNGLTTTAYFTREK
ncbi:MAG: hypothetical protein ACXVJD_17550 [Mucilaginibacter sp.]